jgi:RNA polymerase sigma-70 factor, ECF subfamily
MRADTVEAVAAPEAGIEESMEPELHADEAKREVTPRDEDLMLAWSRGSSEAFAGIFSRYKEPIYGFFRRRTADPAQAEELTQETFLVLVRKAAGYEPRAMFRTYLYAIAFKILRSHRRKAMFRAAFFGETGTKREAGRNDATEAGLWVRRAVEKLDRKDREILMLREYEQLNYDEIGTLLGLPLNTVRSRLFRARAALRELLEPGAEPRRSAASAGTEARVGESL